jgi:RNA polymerase-binding transcription factor DksA
MEPDRANEMQSNEVQAAPAVVVDLDAIAAELADVEVALARLEAGTYFLDEVTGQPLPAAFLAANPTARTLPTA